MIGSEIYSSQSWSGTCNLPSIFMDGRQTRYEYLKSRLPVTYSCKIFARICHTYTALRLVNQSQRSIITVYYRTGLARHMTSQSSSIIDWKKLIFHPFIRKPIQGQFPRTTRRDDATRRDATYSERVGQKSPFVFSMIITIYLARGIARRTPMIATSDIRVDPVL